MRLIDADAIPYTMLYKENWLKGTGVEKPGVWKDTIDAMPTIEPERKTGRWHYSDGKPATIGRSFGVICDQCGTESEYCTNFCGECGADMRGDDDE